MFLCGRISLVQDYCASLAQIVDNGYCIKQSNSFCNDPNAHGVPLIVNNVKLFI